MKFYGGVWGGKKHKWLICGGDQGFLYSLKHIVKLLQTWLIETEMRAMMGWNLLGK